MQGDTDRALADFDQAIKLDPKDALAYSNRGFAWRTKGDMARAAADYEQAIKLDAGNASAFYNRGNAYYEKRDFDRAIADFDQALKINPTYTARSTTAAWRCATRAISTAPSPTSAR